MKYLVDTCVISEFVKPRPAKPVLDWLDGQDEESLFLSVVVVGEITQGIAKLDDAKRRNRLRAWLARDLSPRFGDRILPIDLATAARSGDLAGQTEQRGKPVPVIDGLLAATALVHGLTMATRNVRDFEPLGVPCLDPWQLG